MACKILSSLLLSQTLTVRCDELIYHSYHSTTTTTHHATTLLSHNCHHESLISSELCCWHVTVLVLMVLVRLNSSFAKHFCTISFMPCHPDAAIIMTLLSEPSFWELIWHDTTVGVNQNERSVYYFVTPT